MLEMFSSRISGVTGVFAGDRGSQGLLGIVVFLVVVIALPRISSAIGNSGVFWLADVIDVDWRATEIRTWNNTVHVVPNGKLATASIREYDRPDGVYGFARQ